MAAGPKKAQKDTAVLGKIAAEIKSLSMISADMGVSSSSRESGTLDRNHKKILTLYVKAVNALNRILGTKVGKSKTVTVQTEPRVNNQIFRPDIWYSPPPRCNVIFPEMYDSFSFARQYLREVSRLELQTHNEILGNDALFNGRYYAPNVEDVRRGVKLSSRRFARLIMAHELYTGIIPMFENLSEANLVAMRSGKVKKAGAKVSYAQRAANFQYFKYRFESRSMDASGRFNPLVVPGFPTLIIDKHMDHPQLRISSLNLVDQAKALGIKGSATRSELLQELVSPQYLSVCATLSHSASQEGGRTAYQFIHARVHRESTEFLGVDKAAVYKVVDKSSKTTTVAASAHNPPKKGQKGPRGGKIAKVWDVSKKCKGQTLRLLGRGFKVKVGDWYPDWYFKDVRMAEISQLVGAYEVREDYTRRKKDKIDLPIEEAIRPPWIWDGWANPKVSETYDQLFGTGALTDIGGFNVPSGAPSSGKRNYVGEDDVAGLQAQRAAETSNSLRGKSKKKQKSIRAAAKVEAAKSQNAILMQEKERTVENSVDFLVRAYSFVKVNNLDVGDFLRAYAWRPVATMVDILGSSNLEIKQTTKQVKKVVKQKIVKQKAKVVVVTWADGSTKKVVRAKAKYGFRYVTRTFSQVGYEVKGKEGFHSRAFGDVEDLFGLVSPTVKRVLGLGKKRKAAAKMDVRKRRREVVRLYVAELTGSRGLIG